MSCSVCNNKTGKGNPMPRTKKEEKKGLDRIELLETLNKLKPGLAGKDVIEQATRFVFAEGLVWSYNDEIAVSHPLPETIELEGAVPAEPLLKFLGRASHERVELNIEDNELRIKSGRSRVGIVLEEIKLAVDQIPMPTDDDWCNLPTGCVSALGIAALSASHNMESPILTCLKITEKSAQGCDRFRLTHVEWKPAEAWPGPFLIPSSVIKHLKLYDPEALALCGGWLHFINKDDVVFSCRTAEGDYPDVSKLLKMKGSSIEFPDALGEALDRAGVFAKAEFEQDEEVELETDGLGTLVISAKGEEGWIKEELQMLDECKPLKITLNPQILKQALSLGHKVTVGESALLIKGKNFKHVVALV